MKKNRGFETQINSSICFQISVLYFNDRGERRLRIINKLLPFTLKAVEPMKYINSDYLAVFWLKRRMRHYSIDQGARIGIESIKKTIRSICRVYCESHLY